jgi:hypothetical protein
MRTILLAGLLLCMYGVGMTQDPEFPKNEFIMHVKMHNGMVTSFKSSPDLYVGGLQLVPQFTVVANRLRLGVIADGYYTGKKLQAAAGPTLSLKLKTIELKKFGSGGNINLSLDHLWGTQQQRLFGGGVNIDLLNFIVAGITLHRDYHLNNWWVQGSFGFRISKVKQPPHP